MIPDKERFLEAYAKWSPNALTQFFFRYFSKEVKEEDAWVKRGVVLFFLGTLIWGFFATVFDLPMPWILYPTLIYVSLLPLFVISGMVAVGMNNCRIRKICKHLEISLSEYNIAVSLYLIK